MSSESLTTAKPKISVRMMVQIALLACLGTALMFFEFPLPIAPAFYQIDLSEVPVMIGTFTMGPLAGAVIEIVKILVLLVVRQSPTMGIGEVSNILIGCALCVPAGIIYRRMRSRKGALIGMATGTVFMTVIGCFLNGFVLIPAYAKMLMPLDTIIDAGAAINTSITDIKSLVLIAVVPFNLLKGVIVSIVVLLIYKRISPILKIGSEIRE